MTPFGYRVLGFGSGGAGGFAATGGTETTYGSYQVHTFLSSGTFTVTGGETKAMDILVIGGGGGGGGVYTSGGGGAGGMVVTGSSYPEISAGSFTVTVGAGGASSSPSGGAQGGDGVDSYFGEGDGSFELRGIGGGGGGRYRQDSEGTGRNGGSGGGGTFNGALNASRAGGTSTQTLYADSYALEYGYAGGAGYPSTNDYFMAGGGGGASEVGDTAGSCVYGVGGLGENNDFRTGSDVRYAGGGGGGGGASNCYCWGAAGGGGGGGAGGDCAGGNAAAGGDGYGGGGGGAGQNENSLGAVGGSGIVVIRYLV